MGYIVGYTTGYIVVMQWVIFLFIQCVILVIIQWSGGYVMGYIGVHY